jgi:glycine cleavage system H protein
MSNIPENLKYTEEHEWVSVEGDTATIGITDFAQSSLGDIVFVELPEAGTQYDNNASFGVVESIKSVSDLYTPINCEIIEKNTEVEETPEKLNEDAYSNWLIKVKVNNSAEIDNLMDAAAYKTFCESNA